MNDQIKCKGHVTAVIDYADGRPSETIDFHNTVLRAGRRALASLVVNDVGDTFEYYVNRMLFGNAGLSASKPKYVDESRNGLFCGTPVVSKPVAAMVDPNQLDRAIFVSVLTYDDGNGEDINELALQMANGDLYSMATFGGFSKTSIMQVTMYWALNYL